MQQNKILLLLVIYVAVVDSQKLQTTTESESNEGRIVGGSPAARGQFPHMVAVRVNGSLICGGAIISKRVILTAAHCVIETVSNFSALSVYAGSLFHSEGGIEVGVSRAIVHPNYYTNVNVAADDVAVLILASDLTFSDTIKAISLAASDPPASVFRTVIVAGWGHISDNGPLSNRLLYLYLQPLSRQQCALYGSVFWENTIMCLLPPQNSGTCFGDSGGAAIYRNQIVGIATFGIGGCEDNFPDGYARISTLRLWINNYL